MFVLISFLCLSLLLIFFVFNFQSYRKISFLIPLLTIHKIWFVHIPIVSANIRYTIKRFSWNFVNSSKSIPGRSKSKTGKRPIHKWKSTPRTSGNKTLHLERPAVRQPLNSRGSQWEWKHLVATSITASTCIHIILTCPFAAVLISFWCS